uniref:Uncharacterized protein n=1 Tax=Leersia perrieri TaxID=77586 RepID=A0A0D9UWN9_9ORYZ
MEAQRLRLVADARREQANADDVAASKKIAAALGTLGVAAVSAATALAAAFEPAPDGLVAGTCYIFALSGTFLVGASVGPMLVAAAGLSVAALLW